MEYVITFENGTRVTIEIDQTFEKAVRVFMDAFAKGILVHQDEEGKYSIINMDKVLYIEAQ